MVEVESFESWKARHGLLVAAVSGQITRMGRLMPERPLAAQVDTRLALVRAVADAKGDVAALEALFPGMDPEELRAVYGAESDEIRARS
jgi:hypothetical protein